MINLGKLLDAYATASIESLEEWILDDNVIYEDTSLLVTLPDLMANERRICRDKLAHLYEAGTFHNHR